MAVFVLDKRKKPLMPCTEKRARLLLARGRARVHKLIPFTIRLTDRTLEDSVLQDLTGKLDPGSKTTGIALVREVVKVKPKTKTVVRENHVIFLIELEHRGTLISEKLTGRGQKRRRRRGNLRYRAPRFSNRAKPKGWIPPSLRHRVDTTCAWVKRLQALAPIQSMEQELVRFDMQKLENPEITGTEYQQGTLFGYEAKEYLLDKWKRTCAYCDAKNVPLQVEHIVPKAHGGSDRVSNLTLACQACNQKKSALPIHVFLAKDPKRLKKILAQAKQSLKHAAAVNITRFKLKQSLEGLGLPVSCSTGAQTKFNRTKLNIPKTHALDAACVGNVDALLNWQTPTLAIKCMGRGSYCRTRVNAFGFPRGYLTRKKNVYGFQTGDVVTATVPSGKKAGTYCGRVAVRASGNFNIQTPDGLVQGIHHRFCKVIQRGDGYKYQFNAA